MRTRCGTAKSLPLQVNTHTHSLSFPTIEMYISINYFVYFRPTIQCRYPAIEIHPQWMFNCYWCLYFVKQQGDLYIWIACSFYYLKVKQELHHECVLRLMGLLITSPLSGSTHRNSATRDNRTPTRRWFGIHRKVMFVIYLFFWSHDLASKKVRARSDHFCQVLSKCVALWGYKLSYMSTAWTLQKSFDQKGSYFERSHRLHCVTLYC